MKRRWPRGLPVLPLVLALGSVVACQRASGPRAVIGNAEVAGSASELPLGVVYLDTDDACAAELTSHGGTPAPQWVRSDRDFDGDGGIDVAIADRRACDDLGNCYWQLYKGAASTAAGLACPHFVGEVAGATLAVVENDESPMRLQGIWRLSDARVMRHEYRVVGGRYELQSAAVCALTEAAIVCSTQ
ncbi:MAG: hypothetical protein IPL79_05720 [Myxococcales bacterium]|nr:hypothetical protein [Myxococcales bacterium]